MSSHTHKHVEALERLLEAATMSLTTTAPRSIHHDYDVDGGGAVATTFQGDLASQPTSNSSNTSDAANSDPARTMASALAERDALLERAFQTIVNLQMDKKTLSEEVAAAQALALSQKAQTSMEHARALDSEVAEPTPEEQEEHDGDGDKGVISENMADWIDSLPQSLRNAATPTPAPPVARQQLDATLRYAYDTPNYRPARLTNLAHRDILADAQRAAAEAAAASKAAKKAYQEAALAASRTRSQRREEALDVQRRKLGHTSWVANLVRIEMQLLCADISANSNRDGSLNRLWSDARLTEPKVPKSLRTSRMAHAVPGWEPSGFGGGWSAEAMRNFKPNWSRW